ncbi:hypothetical protein BDV95DRAFT_502717 [Massariosphaeria phaeospora]|uniref:Uncharacterized protein n=1 Tax=Massariosphaeria phaeospora TaxID=100035 RepID=A0A7C8MHN4_9PLEO|nr:hypothetical protein BDV95DRAFT_502717 [Massariosphaeria phaeospora]
MLTPFEKDSKSSPQPPPQPSQQSNATLEPIPSYAEATSAQTANLQAQSSSLLDPIPSYAETSTPQNTNPHTEPSPLVPEDEPPTYAVLDENQTTFMILGTFIHTPAGPVYQISSPLDQRGPFFRLRRLSAKEVAQVGTTPLSFDRSAVLYETNNYPLLDNEYHLMGKRRHCFPGVVELKFGMSKWHVRHVPTPGAKAQEIITCKKTGALFGVKVDRRKGEVEGFEWKDMQGKVLATEALRVVEEGQVIPTVELSRDLNQKWRELLISLWATRLWVAYGAKKTAAAGESSGYRLLKGLPTGVSKRVFMLNLV